MSETLRQNKRRVVVTGMGAVSALGHSLGETWAGVLKARSGGAPIKAYDATHFPCKIAYEVAPFDLPPHLLAPGEGRYLNAAARFGVKAADEARQQAGLAASQTKPERMAVCLGVGLCSPGLDWYEQVFLPKRWDDPSLAEHIKYAPEQLASVLARQFGARGGNTTIHTACASSGQALGEAYEMIAYGEAEVVLTGGTDAMINPFAMAGFDLLGAMSRRNDDALTASRPFTRSRDGFVMGEGACMLVFEDYDHAVARGVRVLAEVCGYGVTESAYRITDLHPEGRGPLEAMHMALADAGLSPQQIGYINAHGTSTLINDRVEALAISKVFGTGPAAPRVSSTKSMTGHMISAAGAIELALCVKSLMHQTLPPSVNVADKDPECLVTLTEAHAVDTKLTHALSNSIGFGGSNTALIVGRVL